MLCITCKWLLPPGISGLTLWPVVIVRRRSLLDNSAFVNHERIHLRQQIEMLVLPFYIWYLTEFLIRWAWYKNIFLAYRNIGFEREAYAEEENKDYLRIRKIWAFRSFLSR